MNKEMESLLKWVLRWKKGCRRRGLLFPVFDASRARCFGQMDAMDWVAEEIKRPTRKIK